MTGLLLLVFMSTVGLWIAAAVRGPRRETREHRVRNDHLLALAISAGVAIVLFVLINITDSRDRQDPATPWHTILSTVLGIGLWAGIAGYWQGRQLLLPGAIALQVFCAGALVLLPFGFDHRSDWGLDFGHAMLLMIFYGLAAIAGLMLANVARPGLLALQVGLFLVGLFFVLGK